MSDARELLRKTAELAADYLDNSERYPVLPPITPGEVRRLLPNGPPEHGEPMDDVLADYRRIVEPNMTHWNHPGFFAYFAVSGTPPGVAGEMLAAALNVNTMLWRSGPASTEMEETVCDWVRQLMGLPAAFRGHINDSASMSTLLAIAAARHRATGGAALHAGLAGSPPLIVYASEHAHSSVDKAMITLGMGLDQLRRIPSDGEHRLIPERLEAAIRADRDAGRVPCAIVASIGTTSSTSVDPVPAIAAIAQTESLWLHVDAAYAGSAAICPEMRPLLAGMEQGDSIVVNPHKWLLTPLDCSLLFLRNPDALKGAFSLVPEYLRTAEGSAGATNLMDYGPQLGRRFRALKLWFVLRAYGAEGLREVIRRHCALAQEFAGWVRSDARFELCAPVPFSTVCFRAVPPGAPEAQDAFNEKLMDTVNRDGAVFLSHTKLKGRYVIRLAIGNWKTERRHIEHAWSLIVKNVQASQRPSV